MTTSPNDVFVEDGSSEATGATTLVDVLARARAHGFTGDFTTRDDATIECASCDRARPARDYRTHGHRRLEGASDAADLLIVVAVRCPACDTGGALVLGYGPNGTPADDAVLGELPLDAHGGLGFGQAADGGTGHETDTTAHVEERERTS